MPLFLELVVSQKIKRDSRVVRKNGRTAKTKAFDCVTGVLGFDQAWEYTATPSSYSSPSHAVRK